MSDADDAARARSAARANALLDQIEALLRARNKIQAIEVYRAATGRGLKEAKDTVDEMEHAMGLPPASVAPFGGLLRAIRGWFGLA